MLRAVIFGLEGVLIKDSAGRPGTGLVSAARDQLLSELTQLFEFLRSKGIRPIVLSNRDWVLVDKEAGTRTPIDSVLTETHGPHRLYVVRRGHLASPKPKKACITELLEKESLQPCEVMMVGVSENDFRTAVNSRLLFINATWDRNEQPYGFVMKNPADVMRFIDLFALKAHPWFYAIDTPVVFRSPAPFSTLRKHLAGYSEVARLAAKSGTPERAFFIHSLVGALYFSNLMSSVSYIACVPGHKVGSGNPAMNDLLGIVGQALRAGYLPDLILRHTAAPSQRAERIAGRQPNALGQLNTLCLNRRPLKSNGAARKTPLDLSGKRVLVFDDFCTRGNSLEASRILLEAAGAEVLMVSWLKTINSDYSVVTLLRRVNPWAPLALSASDIAVTPLPYRDYIIDDMAPGELIRLFANYQKWSPPQ